MLKNDHSHFHWCLWTAWKLIKSRRGPLLNLTSLAAVGGIWLGVLALVLSSALMTGFQQDLKTKLLGGLPHLSIFGREADGISNWDKIIKTLSQLPEITEVIPTVYFQGMALSPTGQNGVFIKGVPDPARHPIPLLRPVSKDILQKLTEKDGILVGAGLAEKLGVFPGDVLTIIIPEGTFSPLGFLPRLKRVRVIGLFHSDMYEFDQNWAFIHLKLAQKWLKLGHRIHALEIFLRDVDKADELRPVIFRHLPDTNYFVETWMDQNKTLFSALELEKWMLFFAITLIMIVASFNIMTHLALLVREKRRPIALMYAMGASTRHVVRIFLYIGTILGTAGLGGGFLMGIIGAWILDTYKLIRLPAEVYFIPYLPFRLNFTDLIAIFLSAWVIILISTWLPTRVIGKLKPSSILRLS